MRVVGAFVLSVGAAPRASALDTYGPWTFADDTPFADSARLVQPPSVLRAEDVRNLVGNTPQQCMYNVGYPCAAEPEIVELGFRDVPIINVEGHDLVVFDAPFSINTYEIAVEPEGADFTPYRAYDATVATTRGGCESTTTFLRGVPVDISDFGLGHGAVVRTIRIKGDCTTNPGTQSDGAEMDVVMAAVLNGANSCAATVCRRCPYEKGCQPCTNDGDCGTTEFPGYCAAHGFCAKCLSDQHCPSSMCSIGRCAAELGQCVAEPKPGCVAQPAPPAAMLADAGANLVITDASTGAVAEDEGEGGCACRVAEKRADFTSLLTWSSACLLLMLRNRLVRRAALLRR